MPDNRTIHDFKKFEARGERIITRVDVEDSEKGLHALIWSAVEEMRENLEGYLYVTTPVREWQVLPVVQSEMNFMQDAWSVQMKASGWFDCENDGEVEIIVL